MRVKLGKLHSVFRLNVWQKPPACRTSAQDTGTDSVLPQDRPYGLKAYTGFSDGQLVEHLNRDTADFLWNCDSPSFPP